MFDELSNERMSQIRDIEKQMNFNNLTYYFISKSISPTSFIGFTGPMHIYNNIKNGNKSTK